MENNVQEALENVESANEAELTRNIGIWGVSEWEDTYNKYWM